MKLLVKGPAGEAIFAAAAQGISASPVYEDGERNTTMLNAHDTDDATVSRWYAKPAKVEDGRGFPNGTLLWFREDV